MDTAAYGVLFLSALLAATIIPAQSETVLLALVASEKYALWLLLVVASIGNILGAVINWWIGQKIERFRDKRWFPVKSSDLSKAQDWYHRYGRWTLLLSWVPIIGDPLTIAAGIMRERLPVFLTLVSIAKTGRYVFLIIGYMAVTYPMQKHVHDLPLNG